jgi:hypothetical protein
MGLAFLSTPARRLPWSRNSVSICLFGLQRQQLTQHVVKVGSPITEIKRFYVQNGNVIPNSNSQISGTSQHNQLSRD